MVTLNRRRFIAAGAAALGLGAAGCTEAARRTEWSGFRAAGDNRASTREHPGDGLELAWTVDLAERYAVPQEAVSLASPVGDTETVYVASRVDLTETEGVVATGLAAVDVATGSVAWARLFEQADPAPDPLAHPAVVWDDLVLAVGGRTATVLERATGAGAFEISLPWHPTTVPGGDRALVALGGDLVAMLDLDEDRDVRWTLPPAGRRLVPVNPLTVLDGDVLIPVDDRIVALRRGDGEQIWELAFSPGAPAVTTPPLVDGQFLHLRVRTDDGTEALVAIRRGDRGEHWRRPLGAAASQRLQLPAYRGGRLYVLHAGHLRSIRAGDGTTDVEATVDVDAPYPTVGGDDVYLLGDDELVVVGRTDAEVRQRIALPGEPGATPQEAVPRAGTLVVSRRDRLLGLQPG